MKKQLYDYYASKLHRSQSAAEAQKDKSWDPGTVMNELELARKIEM
jgi:hypothetical protein